MKWFRNNIKPSLSPDILHNYLKNTGRKNRLICYAPFSVLYFKPDGLIKPCCAHANEQGFGYYPDTSISEALKSANRKSLQKHMKGNSLEFGCQSCLSNISNKNFRGSISSLYNQDSSGKYPERIDFELSHFCNLNCIMCNSHTIQNNNNNNNRYDVHFLKELEPNLSRLKEASFLGGEPFLIEIYTKIWDYLANHNKACKVYIQTNGTVFNTAVKDVLNKLNVNLGISIDAITPALYEYIRKGADFDKVMKNIQYFNEISKAQGKPLTFSFCTMPQNWQEIPEFLRFADRLESKVFFNTVRYPYHFSFKYTPSTDLKNIIQELNNFSLQNSNNPYQKENFDAFQDFVSDLTNLFEEQLKIEKEYHKTITLKNLLIELGQLTKNENLFAELKILMEDFDMNMPVSPYIQAYLKQTDKNKLISFITGIVKEKNILFLKNIFNIAH